MGRGYRLSSLAVTVKLTGVTHSDTIRLAADTNNTFPSPIFSDPVILDPEFFFVRGTINNLAANTAYFIAVEVNGVIVDNIQGEATTPPTGTHSFTFGLGGDTDSGQNSIIFDNMRTKAENGTWDFFIHLGDRHYDDVNSTNEDNYMSSENTIFAQSRQEQFYRSLPIFYMWDDHDFCGDNTDEDETGRDTAVSFYRKHVPSVPLELSGSTDAVYYSFVRGRVRFIATDTRSERVPNGTFATTNIAQEMMSTTQLAWLKAEFDAAAAAGQAIIWINTSPWIVANANGDDSWGGFDAQRQDIASYITTNSYDSRIAIISADMHALAYDDGTSSNNAASLPVCHAAPMQRSASTKGGPYLDGPITAQLRQFGQMEVTDTGGATISFRFLGISVASGGAETTEIDRTFTLDA